MKVLITGIAGLLGSSFARWLRLNEPGCEIEGIDDLSCGYDENVPEGVPWHYVPLGESWPITRGIFDRLRPDYVFHFAAYAAEGLSPFIRTYNYRNNFVATAEIINGCIATGVKRLVFTSSMAVYGRGAPPFDESQPRNPIDPYGVAKAACERDIEIAGEQHKLDWCIIRPHNVYGPGQSIWQDYRNVLGIWMARHLQGLPLLVYGDGKQVRAFSFIEGCLPCLWAAATRPVASKQIINLGGAKPVTISEAADTVSGVIGARYIEFVEPRHEVKQAWCTTDKSAELLGYQQSVSLEDGVDRMWTWAKSAWNEYPERRNSSASIEIEVDRGLYSFWRRKTTPK